MPKKSKIKVDPQEAAARVKKILPLLRKTYPEAKIALNYKTPLELMVATILSAQCTDVRVNIVTKDLFKKYTSAADWASADIKQIADDIRSTGFYKNKSRNIKAAAQKIISDFDSGLPGTMEELLTLPGIGRKTANVLLGNLFDTPGVVCDTHVIRLSRRLGLSENVDPVKLEFDLQRIVPKKSWLIFSDLLIFHGRNICKARKPNCPECPVAKQCPAANNPKLW